ncbi:MAG: ABC transporter ATP-binding protein [Clostridium paraputrificum]
MNNFKKKYQSLIIKKLLQYKKNFNILLVLFLLETILTFFQPILIKSITDYGLTMKNICYVLKYSLILIIIVIVGQLLEVIMTYIFSSINNKFSYDLYSSTFLKVMKIDSSFFLKQNSAEILTNIKTDISNVSMITDRSFIIAISNIFKIVSGIVGLLTISIPLTIIVILLIPLKLGIVYILSKKQLSIVEKQLEHYHLFHKWFADTINGIKEIKIMNLDEDKKRIFDSMQKKIIHENKNKDKIQAWNSFADTTISWIINILIYIFGGIFLIKGSISIGEIFAFIAYSGFVINPIVFILNLKYAVGDIIPSFKRLDSFLNESEESEGPLNIDIKSPCLELENVYFNYPDGHQVLNGVNLKIEPGQKIALTGLNGSGKSTLAEIILKFLKPTSGKILINGENIENYKISKYRQCFSVVNQFPYLFFDTIKNNICLDQEVPDKDYELACNLSGVTNFLENLPQGDRSIIGNNGCMLSGGERQKLALARAILRKAPIIILDEATANYDNVSDEILHEFLTNEITKESSVILITHNSNHLEYVDYLYKIDNGQLSLVEKESL